MIEEPCIIQMNIDRYRAMLGLRLPDEDARASSNCSTKRTANSLMRSVSLRVRLFLTINVTPSTSARK